MDDPIDFDPGLAGLWPVEADGGRARRVRERAARRATEAVLIETKAVARAASLATLLNQLTTELKKQFAAFRTIRRKAEAVLAGGDEAEGKAARADIKAATDALALIVRTLEKIDGLQRGLAEERQLSAVISQEDYDDLLAIIVRKIEARAAERLRDELVRLGLEPGAVDRATGPPGDGAQPE